MAAAVNNVELVSERHATEAVLMSEEEPPPSAATSGDKPILLWRSTLLASPGQHVRTRTYVRVQAELGEDAAGWHQQRVRLFSFCQTNKKAQRCYSRCLFIDQTQS